MRRRALAIALTLATMLAAATLRASDPERERQLQQGIDLLERTTPAISWTRAGLFIAHGDSETLEIARVSIDDGTLQPTGLDHARGQTFDISRDGRQVVYSHRTRTDVEELWGGENLLSGARRN